MDLKALLDKVGLNETIRGKAGKAGRKGRSALQRIGLDAAALRRVGARLDGPVLRRIGARLDEIVLSRIGVQRSGADGAAAVDGRARIVGGSAVALVALFVVLLLIVGSCGGDGAPGAVDKRSGGGEEGEPKGRSEAALAISPEHRADGVATSDVLEVAVEKGRLARVLVRDSEGRYVDGEFGSGRTVWKPESHLLADMEYSIEAVAKDSAGRMTEEHTTFSTAVPEDTFIGRFQPENGDEVGVGMPVSLSFDRAISERKRVEDAISVTAEPGVEIEGHWFGNSRLDFRPEEYWEPGTEVTLSLDLDGIEGADGVYGTQKKSVTFSIGRSQVSVVDAKKKTMTVTRDGEKIKTVPVTSGAPATPTYNGIMVVSEKHEVTRMDGATVGFTDDDGEGEYDIKDVPHAMRLSTSGTFIHGNYWAGQAAFGEANLSHGCIGLFDKRGGGNNGTPGAWFFRNSMIGDVVQVENSNDETIQPDNGYNGWNLDWEAWTAEQ